MFSWQIIAGVFLGWSLGSNDSANVFGTAVATKMVKYTTAVILCAIFIVLGAWLEGEAGFHRLSSLVEQNANEVFICSLASGLTVTLMTILKLPVSTSQAIVGGIFGVALASGKAVDLGSFGKLIICWIGTPIGGFLVAMIMYWLARLFLQYQKLNFFEMDKLLRWGLILSGIYGSYALGANNVANVTGIYVGAGLLSVEQASLIGGLSIAVGVMTFSRNVMMTVGKGLIPLNGVGAFIAVLSHAIVVHFYAQIGVPVSTSQAIVGSVMGVGIVLQRRTDFQKLIRILQAWIMTPVVSATLTIVLLKIFL